MNKNEQYEALIEDVGSNGEGICHIDGKTVFVPFVLPGEKCIIHILKVKDDIAYAKVVSLKQSSQSRVAPRCPYFSKCGGCVLQHAGSDFELEAKKKQIQTCFQKYAGINVSVTMIDSGKHYSYRNKCAFPVRNINGKASVCMFKQNSHNAIEIKNCPLADDLINKVVKIFNMWLEKNNISAYDEEKNKGDVKFLVCRVLDGKALITIVTNKNKLTNVDKFTDMLQAENVDFGLNLNINKVNNNVILTDKFVHVAGLFELEGDENGVKYPISSMSFMQVNDSVKSKIYNKAFSFINSESVVIDAYSGAGLMSAMLAARAKQVYGIEIIEAATKNADCLAKYNNIKNLENINGDCANVLPNLVKRLKSEKIQIVLDPPRKGCDKKVLDAVIEAFPSTIIYISCNPATLARDTKILLLGGYKIKEVSGFNMFPQTHHVETVAIFENGDVLNEN